LLRHSSEKANASGVGGRAEGKGALKEQKGELGPVALAFGKRVKVKKKKNIRGGGDRAQRPGRTRWKMGQEGTGGEKKRGCHRKRGWQSPNDRAGNFSTQDRAPCGKGSWKTGKVHGGGQKVHKKKGGSALGEKKKQVGPVN